MKNTQPMGLPATWAMALPHMWLPCRHMVPARSIGAALRRSNSSSIKPLCSERKSREPDFVFACAGRRCLGGGHVLRQHGAAAGGRQRARAVTAADAVVRGVRQVLSVGVGVGG